VCIRVDGRSFGFRLCVVYVLLVCVLGVYHSTTSAVSTTLRTLRERSRHNRYLNVNCETSNVMMMRQRKNAI